MRLAIPDMECDGCVSAITRAIRAQDANSVVVADLASHSVEVTGALPLERLVAVIEEAGYTVGGG
jgi:copper chaperone